MNRKTWALFAATVAAAALFLGACGDPRSEAGGAPPPDTPVSSSPDAGRTPAKGEPQQVTPRPGMSDVRPVPWWKAKPSEDERTITLLFYSGVEPCYVLDRVEVEETDEVVTVTLFEGSDPGKLGAACIEIALLKSVDVTLDEPLGNRRLRDGAKAKQT